MSEEFIIGRNPVMEAIRSGRDINKIWVSEGANKGQIHKLLELANQNKVLVQTAPNKKLDGMVKGNHQGVVAQVAAYEYVEIDDLFEVANSRNEQPFFLILDEIEDPHNLGSIMRTADAVGAHGIIIPKRRAVGLTSAVAKASTGAIEYIPVARVTNLARTVDDLKQRGVWIFGTDAKGADDYRNMDGQISLGLIIGSEGKGMSRILKEKCDFLIKLPMVGKVTSLNASVAASLLMYEIHRKRHPLGS